MREMAQRLVTNVTTAAATAAVMALSRIIAVSRSISLAVYSGLLCATTIAVLAATNRARSSYRAASTVRGKVSPPAGAQPQNPAPSRTQRENDLWTLTDEIYMNLIYGDVPTTGMMTAWSCTSNAATARSSG